MAIPDHYAALGIDPSADQEVIAAAYRALAKKYHPDTGATAGTASAERFAEIQQAYEVLGSTDSRRRYDMELLEETKRELDEHLSRKRRLLDQGTAPEAPPPPPDLGIIRPERRMAHGSRFKALGSLREMGPFLVVSGLLLAVVGGLSSLFLSASPELPGELARLEEPPLPQVAAAPEPAAEPEAPAEPPLFGTSMLDEPAEAPPLPAPEIREADAAQSDAPEAEAAPVPIPRAKPSRVASAEAAQAAEAPEPPSRRYSLVIYERDRGGDTLADEGGVVFSSMERCSDFGERAVLRRLASHEGDPLRPRIWYQCREAR